MLSVRSKETVSMLTRDGVRLDADVYRPDATGEFPVLLMRQPYGRAIASTVVYAHPTWYAAHGYIVVIQDARGRGSSAGEFDLFAPEIEDGFDTVSWAANLPGSTGKVGMYGFSYQGMTQLYAAAAKPSALKTICPSMIGYDLYHDWAYEGGAFCYQLNLGWAIQLSAETVRRQGDAEAYRKLYTASRNPPLQDPICVQSELLNQLDPHSFYHNWVDHPRPDEYWDKLSPMRYLKDVDLPVLHIGGWFDTYLRGTLRFYREMASRSAFRQQLLVGPWAHLPWGRRVGALDYGAEAANPSDRLQIRWFDQFLKGLNTGLLDEPPVNLFEMGSNRWRTFDTFPTSHQTYFLATTGLASMGDAEGTLTPNPLASIPDRAISPPNSLDTLIHDPWRPVPSLGGHATMPAGAFDRATLDCRTDILTYTSAPLTEDLQLTGDITVEIHCTADSLSFDLCAVLSEVKPDGSVYNFSQGYLRVECDRPAAASLLETVASPTETPARSASPELCQIVLQPTCIQISKGNALRLSLSAASFPAYAVNSGTGSASGEAQLINAQVITLIIHCEGNSCSQVLLPVIL